MVGINVKLKDGFEEFGIPSYKTSGSAAADLRAAIEKTLILKPRDSSLILTGLFVEIPEGYMVHITPRSGFALKHGISIVNSPGIIDSDYRGEIGVIMINHGKESFKINRGDRIAQMSVVKAEKASFKLQENISDTERGSGGFGHTGRE
ncbi:dUTP diphosphatase [Candidatus Woesearchaeota archaeon]|jgi:dUTP pyrophosphatase|nr:dUTP diphosphatase [Candidatus Woesearchaeota archaeon]|tara:strand:- start:3223 stop:3669 length:447 start_codon:yes stop_codon:yes gene_type:complete